MIDIERMSPTVQISCGDESTPAVDEESYVDGKTLGEESYVDAITGVVMDIVFDGVWGGRGSA